MSDSCDVLVLGVTSKLVGLSGSVDCVSVPLAPSPIVLYAFTSKS